MTRSASPRAASITELTAYLRASSCLEPSGHQYDHNHYERCLTTPAA